MPSKTRARIKIAVTVAVAAAVCWVAGCAKKSGQEAVPETNDTLSVTSDTLSKTYDTLLVTHDTLPEIPNTLTDKRDGKTYKTVTIWKQAWMAENLNYATLSGSWCYEYDSSYCDTYGRLYDWNTAKTVCPSGWHLPSREEWDVLAQAVGGRKYEEYWPDRHDWYDAGKYLKSQTGCLNLDSWIENLDTYGFSALPGGCRFDGGYFGNTGYDGYWWTATEYDSSNAYFRGTDCRLNDLDENKSTGDGNDGFSVRCVMDKGATGALSQKSVGDDRVKIEMVFVKGGTFMMGCTKEQEGDCWDDEKPAHSVTVSDFYICKYEVTQNQWVQVMGDDNNPSYFKGGNLPVEQVSWSDAQKFILRLNLTTGEKYRLPTEAEWEYAARGGANSKGYKYSGSNSGSDVAWYRVNSYDKFLESNKSRTRAVGTKAPNELGIYDMSGNVWEWVNDWYGDYSSAAQTNPKGPSSGSYRVFRGGSWGGIASGCRVSSRDDGFPYSGRLYNLGFRLALPP